MHVSQRASAPFRCKGAVQPCKKRGHMSNRGSIRMKIRRFLQKRGAYEELLPVSNGPLRLSPQVAAARLRSDPPRTSHMPLVFAWRARFPFESATGSSHAPFFCIASIASDGSSPDFHSNRPPVPHMPAFLTPRRTAFLICPRFLHRVGRPSSYAPF